MSSTNEFSPIKRFGPTPIENSKPLIGFDLRHNWAEICEVPPSGGLDEFYRKSARNDYPLLALIEMRIRAVRIPINDLKDPLRRKRLAALHHLGFSPTLFEYGIPTQECLTLIDQFKGFLTDLEITIEWKDLPDYKKSLSEIHEQTGLPIYLSKMRSKEDVAEGAIYYHVINHGFTLEDTEQLEQFADLAQLGVAVPVFRMGNQLPVMETLTQIEQLVGDRSLKASVHLCMAGENPAIASALDDETLDRVATAIEFMKKSEFSRIFCDTLMDNDRGYFVRQGAIDRTGNPSFLLNLIQSAHLQLNTS